MPGPVLPPPVHTRPGLIGADPVKRKDVGAERGPQKRRALLEIPKTVPRVIPVDATLEDRAHGQRTIDEELARRTAEVAEHVPGSRFDEIEFTSLGPNVEIKVENPFDWVPNRREVISLRGDWQVWEPREDLADPGFLYLMTSAPKGAKFVARVWRV